MVHIYALKVVCDTHWAEKAVRNTTSKYVLPPTIN